MSPLFIVVAARQPLRLSGYVDHAGGGLRRGIYRVRWDAVGRRSSRLLGDGPPRSFQVSPRGEAILCDDDRITLLLRGVVRGSISAHFPNPAGWLGGSPVIDNGGRLYPLVSAPEGIRFGSFLPADWRSVATNATGTIVSFDRKGRETITLRRPGRPDIAWSLGIGETMTPKALGSRFFSIAGGEAGDMAVDGRQGTMRRLPRNLTLACLGDSPGWAWGTTEIWNRSGRRPLRTGFWTVDLRTLRRRRIFSLPGAYGVHCLSDDGGWLIASKWIAAVGPSPLVAIDLRAHTVRTLWDRAYDFMRGLCKPVLADERRVRGETEGNHFWGSLKDKTSGEKCGSNIER